MKLCELMNVILDRRVDILDGGKTTRFESTWGRSAIIKACMEFGERPIAERGCVPQGNGNIIIVLE